MKSKSKLTSRELQFCICYLNTGNACEAAISAGYVKNPKQEGERLLCRDDIADKIEQLSRQREKSLSNMASVGYQRLAFGNIADAVSLLYMDNPSREQLSSMDLFLVSEIKKPKDGTMEIKFFDRIKALEKLENTADYDGGKSIFDAISEGAKAVRGDNSDD